MPPGDLVLAELPAQQDGLTVQQRREVDQTAVEVLHLRSVGRYLVDESRQPPCETVDLGGRRGELRGRDPTAVAADLPLELFLPLDCNRVLLPGRDELLHEGTDLVELCVRLLRREVTHRPNPMLRRRGGRSRPAPPSDKP